MSFGKATPILFYHGDRGAADRAGIVTAIVMDRRFDHQGRGEETKQTGREQQ